jgi:ABC-type molybdate transport system substrate-binding protein
VFAAALLASCVAVTVAGQAPAAPAVVTPNSGDYDKADVRVLTPGVVFMSGLPDVAAVFTKETKKTVGINTVGMGTIVEEIGKRTPPPDMIVLPFQLMNSLALERRSRGGHDDSRSAGTGWASRCAPARRSRTSRRPRSSSPR